MSKIGERLREARIKLGLSQTDLASIFGISSRQIANLENAEEIKKAYIEIFSEKYSISQNWLLHGAGDMFVIGNTKTAATDTDFGSLYFEHDFAFSLFADSLQNMSSKIIDLMVDELYNENEDWALNHEEPQEGDPFFTVVKLIRQIEKLYKSKESKNEIRNLELQLKAIKTDIKKDLLENNQAKIKKFLDALGLIMHNMVVG